MITLDPAWLVIGGGLIAVLCAFTGLIVGWYGHDELEQRRAADWDRSQTNVR